MELRRVEDELKSHCKAWQELRRVARGGACDDGDPTTATLPTLDELFSTINDEDIFPEPEEEPEEEDETQLKDQEECEDHGKKNNTENSSSVVAAKPTLSTSESIALSANMMYIGPEEVEEDMIDEEMAPHQILEKLEKIKTSLTSLAPKMNKFLQRLSEKDAVSGKPRYGDKTMIRVKQAIRAYKALELGLSGVFQDHTSFESIKQSNLASNLRKQVQMQEEQMNEQRRALQTQEQIELERIANEKSLAEKREMELRLQEEQRKREEELELSRRAEEARRRRIEEEQLALAAEREADANLLSLVPTKGPEGVREQFERMRQALKEDRAAFDVALGSLYTLFDQICRKPEEVSFRRVRRDHPKFNEDIGRHVGGKEVLIAAGFRLETLDGVKCFFSSEPNIEHDMNGWSDWFDGLKKTLEVIGEEMIK